MKSSTGQVVIRNALWVLTARIASQVIAAGTSIIVVRYLGVILTGQYSYVSVYAMLFGLLASFGLNIFLTREVARQRDLAGRYLGNALVLQLILCVATFGLTVMSGYLFHFPPEKIWLIGLANLGVVLGVMANPYIGVLMGLEKMQLSSLIDISTAMLRTVSILTVLILKQGLFALFGAIAASSLFSLFIAHLISSAGQFKWRLCWDRALSWQMIASSFPFAVMAILNTAYLRLDVIMLEHFQGDRAVGLYSVAWRVVDILMMVPSTVGGVLFPRLSFLHSVDPVALERVLGRTFRILTFAGFGSAMLLTILAPSIVEILFGAVYRDSASCLRILIWAGALFYSYFPFAHALNATGNERLWVVVLGINMLVNVVLNFYLIPHFSYIGTAITKVVCEAIGALLVFWFVVQKIGRFRAFERTVGVATLAVTLALLVKVVGNHYVILFSIGAVLCYVLILRGLNFWKRGDIEILRAFIPAGRSH